MSLCKVVYGSCADGFKDTTKPMSYEDCLAVLRERWEANPEAFGDPAKDPHYEYSYDIMSVETGRLMSWVIK